jgi:hypothetical protein
MRLAQQMIRQQRPVETPSQFAHNMRPTYNDLNESCMLGDGPIVMHELLFIIFAMIGIYANDLPLACNNPPWVVVC